MRKDPCGKSGLLFLHDLLLKGYEKGKNTKTDEQLLHHTKPQDSEECLHFITDRADKHSYHRMTLQALKLFTCEIMT